MFSRFLDKILIPGNILQLLRMCLRILRPRPVHLLIFCHHFLVAPSQVYVLHQMLSVLPRSAVTTTSEATSWNILGIEIEWYSKRKKVRP